MPASGLSVPAPGLKGPSGPSITIAEIYRRMEELLERFDRTGDYRAVFLRSYRIITGAVRQSVQGASFSDVLWLTALDVQFAQEYFDALEGYEAGRPIPRCWQLAFDLGARRRTSVLADLVLGMNAHILHDLPIAVWKLGLGDGARVARNRDFASVDDLLAHRINEVQRQVCRYYSLALWVLDQATGQLDELYTDASLRLARARAWSDALALIDAPDAATRDGLLASLDERACAAGRIWQLKAEAEPGWLNRWLRLWDRRLARAWWRRG